MKKLLAVAAMFSFVACGSSICKTQQSGAVDFKKKHAACAELVSGVPTITDDQVKACDAASSACTADDKKKIDEATACVNGLAACTMDTQTAFLAALQACQTKREGVTATCTAAFPR